MTESDINISTFCTNIFRQFCYISFLNYLVQKKKTEQEESLEGVIWTRRDYASQDAINRPRRWLSLSFILKQKLPFSNCLAV